MDSLLPLSPEWQKQADCIAPKFGQDAANSIMAMRAKAHDLVCMTKREPMTAENYALLLDGLYAIDSELQSFDPPTDEHGEPMLVGTPE